MCAAVGEVVCAGVWVLGCVLEWVVVVVVVVVVLVVAVMRGGELVHFGTYHELVAAGVSFQSLTGAHEEVEGAWGVCCGAGVCAGVCAGVWPALHARVVACVVACGVAGRDPDVHLA